MRARWFHDAGLYDSNAQRGNHQNEKHEPLDGSELRTAHPRRSERTEQEVCDGQDEISEHQGAAKAEAVGESAADNGEKPDDEAKGADEPPVVRSRNGALR